MKYVLSDSTARFLRELKAKAGGYQAAAPTPPRQLKRDTSTVSGTPKFHFRYTTAAETSGGQTTTTASIGEGVVQIGGYSYFTAGGTVANMGSGTRYVCVVVTLASGAVSFAAYATTAALNLAQSDLSTYIFPLYKVVDYVVSVDYRPLPQAGCWEIAESVGAGGEV